ncbi:chloramphenicol-sensitive protein RarD [Tranquillimonas alkanivorans]|uniref:Chloramphenicol-sensitive protein RarD n=2 Tax=Tranquillimonas alkanivorans TaxID=441119 RepID=A0A1I5NSL8_9RHOB|nr:chloramphenicol-sensitive protein RarD [Tranquillimonas alkanivorans]
MVSACVIWGLSPLFYKLLSHIPPSEVLAHRTIWSFVFFGCVLLVQGRIRLIKENLSTARATALTLAAALAISTNWFLFITSITIGRAVEASLGYYIFPLVAVLFGMIFFGERLTRAQMIAVALATLAVVGLTVALRAPPWISLALATSFAIYGAFKKQTATGPVVSVTSEVLLLSPIALGWLFYLWQAQAMQVTTGADVGLLLFSGPLTGLPLILFSYASRRVRMATVGLLQYLNPTLQFLVATLIFLEPFTPAHGVAFGLIWVALAVYSLDGVRRDRAARRAARAGAPAA